VVLVLALLVVVHIVIHIVVDDVNLHRVARRHLLRLLLHSSAGYAAACGRGAGRWATARTAAAGGGRRRGPHPTPRRRRPPRAGLDGRWRQLQRGLGRDLELFGLGRGA